MAICRNRFDYLPKTHDEPVFLASVQFTSGRDGTGSAPVPTSPAGQHRTPTQTYGAASRTYTPLALAEFNLILLLQWLVSWAESVGMTVKSARQFSCAGQSLARPELRKQDCWMRASPFLTTVRDRVAVANARILCFRLHSMARGGHRKWPGTLIDSPNMIGSICHHEAQFSSPHDFLVANKVSMKRLSVQRDFADISIFAT